MWLSSASRIRFSKSPCYEVYLGETIRTRPRHSKYLRATHRPERHHYTRAITQHLSSRSLATGPLGRALLTKVRGQSGRLYKVERILQDKGNVAGRVFLATSGDNKYILKEIPHHNYSLRLEVYQRLGGNRFVRDLEDEAPDQSIFIFKYLNENLLSLIQRDLPVTTVKQVLKQALQGIAAMHMKDIVHNDIKPNNILVEVSGNPDAPTIKQVMVTDLEDSAYCPPPGNLIGAQLGNWMWRSPEAHAQGPMNKPSDLFAFAIVCIYAVTKRIIFGVSNEEREEGVEILSIVLERQLSYFGDLDSFDGFIAYVQNAQPGNPWVEIFQVIRAGFDAEHPREPFALWQEDPPFDENFRDLIMKMANLDPRRRITAQEALDHVWFKEL